MFPIHATQKHCSRLTLRSLAVLLCLFVVACGSQFAPKTEGFDSEFVAELSTRIALANSQSIPRALPQLADASTDGEPETTPPFLAPAGFKTGITSTAASYHQPQHYIAARDRYRHATPRGPPFA